MLVGSGRFSQADVVRSGFRLTVERPWLIVILAMMSLLYNVAGSLFAAVTAGPSIERIVDMFGRPNPDPDAAGALLAHVAPTYAVLVVSGLVVNGVFLAAANRAIQHPSGERSGYVGLGREALMQFGLLLVLTIIGSGVVLTLLLVSAVVGVLLAPAVAQILGGVIALAGLGFVWVRFSLASPLAYVQGRIDLPQAWALTRGRFWDLVRIYLVVLLLAAVVYLLGAVVIDMGMSAAFGGASKLDALARLDFTSPAALLAPGSLARQVLQAALSALILPVLLCPPIEIYRALTSAARGGLPPAQGASPWG